MVNGKVKDLQIRMEELQNLENEQKTFTRIDNGGGRKCKTHYDNGLLKKKRKKYK